MPTSSLASALVKASLLSQEIAVQAERRCQLYGGGLDTVLLEMGLLDEQTLVTHLANITGIPAAPLDRLARPDLRAGPWLDAGAAARLGAVPIGRREDALELAVHPEANHDALVGWAGERHLLLEPYLVTEARFRGLLGVVYHIPVPPRFVSLLAKLMGAAPARRWLALAQPCPAIARAPAASAAPAIDEVETLIETARLGNEPARRAAWRSLSRRLRDPRVAACARSLQAKLFLPDPAVATSALTALAELRDPSSVPAIIDWLESENEQASLTARATLLALAGDDLGPKRKRWLDWWEEMQHRPRLEWLLDALAHRDPAIRLAASQELQEVTGEYFGYHYDLPERDREEARRRWLEWWQNTGHRRFS
jgi:Type II secretion system (T2SS), protein E, N-terminal domain